MSDNAIHDNDADEWRSALYGLTELERAAACGHDYRPNRRGGGTCTDCGEEVYADEL